MGMTYGSLFAGIGGIDLGLERAGFTCRWQVETDPYCIAVLEKHWPDIPKHGDIRTLDPTILGSVDLICGGFPCQPVSAAGRRRGTEDQRWLWPEFTRILRAVRPRWVLVENVPGLLSIDSGRLFGGMLRDLAEIGYDAEWDCIPALAVGAPHIRDRIFLVAYPRSARLGRESRGAHGNEGANEGRTPQESHQPSGDGQGSGARIVAHPHGPRELQPQGGKQTLGRRACDGGADMADTDPERWNGRPRVFGPGRQQELAGSRWWVVEPDVGRMAHGVSARVDRLRALGNAVVPQVAEWLGRRILDADRDAWE